MHMSDALLSPAVGGGMWVGTVALIGWSVSRLKRNLDERKVPLMGVMGAFVFAAQMINIAIPGTGSSGHLGGGLLLAVLLGPHAAFLALFSVLAVQALLFGDGGLLALGANAFNLGFFPCFVCYPLFYRTVVGTSSTRARIFAGALLAGIVGLQFGSLGVVAQTTLSGLTELPALPFLLLMQPIHLAIGVIEGLATAGVLLFVTSAGIVPHESTGSRRAALAFLTSALLLAGVVSFFASTQPDGLEWAVERAGHSSPVSSSASPTASPPPASSVPSPASPAPEAWSLKPAPPEPAEALLGTSATAGIVGTIITLLAAGLVALALRRKES
jgi:cobalt/nickel transport system permease protein